MPFPPLQPLFVVLEHLWKQRNNFLLIASNAHQSYFYVDKQKWQRGSERQMMWTLIADTNKGIVGLIIVDLGSSRVSTVLSVPWAKILASIVFSKTAQMALFHPQRFYVLHFTFYVSSVWAYPACSPQKSLPRSCSPVMWPTNQRCTILSAQLRTEKQPSCMHYLGYCRELCWAFQIDIQERLKGSYRTEFSWNAFPPNLSYSVTHDHSFYFFFKRKAAPFYVVFLLPQKCDSFWTLSQNELFQQ